LDQVTHREVKLSLAWPRLDIIGAGEERWKGQDVIENSVVKARPDVDGKRGFALKCVHYDGSRRATFREVALLEPS
jgi:hypothetical protein